MNTFKKIIFGLIRASFLTTLASACIALAPSALVFFIFGLHVARIVWIVVASITFLILFLSALIMYDEWNVFY